MTATVKNVSNFFIIIIIVAFAISHERLPRPLPDGDYNLLVKFLKEKRVEMQKKYSPQMKRVYRLYKSGKYMLENINDPISGKNEVKLVRLNINFLHYLNFLNVIECFYFFYPFSNFYDFQTFFIVVLS